MRYRIENWTIQTLIDKHREEVLALDPPYQRMFIWSLDDQRTLIESISHNYPVPNIFLRELTPGRFEMVDGQQRTRTIIGFYSESFSDFENNLYTSQLYPNFLSYLISIIIIEEIASEDISIEEFYALVNSSGIHLNRPEVKKAAHYDTKFLELVSNCNDYPAFKDLKLFTDNALKRMNDVDFTSELVVQLKDGITDKKESVDRAFESDVTQSEYDELFAKFVRLSDTFSRLNLIYPIRRSRYRQRNDFYTLFGFWATTNMSETQQDYFYKILILIGEDIFPSNDECISLQLYARNCVTQSNSRSSRIARKNFFDLLFLNESNIATEVQSDVIQYYNLGNVGLENVDGRFTINLNLLMEKKPSIIFH